MKKLSFLIIAVMAMSVFTGCKSEKKETPKPNVTLEPKMHLSSEDTVGVKKLCSRFFSRLKNKDLDGAVGMLYRYDNNKIARLTPDLVAKEATTLGMFLGMQYDIDHIIFLKDYDSEVKYTVTMFEKTDPNDKRPNKASFLIRPVRYHGEWYLTLADTQTDRVKSEIQH